MIIAFFDFDGTITTKDSLACFIQYAVGKPAYYFGLLRLLPILIKYKLKLVPNHAAKETMLAYFFKGWHSIRFNKIANQYSTSEINKIIRKNAMQKIIWHQQQGHEVVIVSASLDAWLRVWCQNNNLELIATGIEIKNGTLTGKLSTKNCYGKEKVNRINQQYDLSTYDIIFSYGDSIGDQEMLCIATHKHYKYFH